MLDRLRLGVATAVLVTLAVACVPAAQNLPKESEKKADPSGSASQTFEVLVQYRAGTKEADKAAVRKSVHGRLKEHLSTPGLEVLLVPKTEKLDSPDRVVTALRRNKSVRVAETQQVYTKQPSGGI